MSPADFRQWMTALDLSGADVVRLTGLTKNTVTKYQRDGTEIPRYVALACAAIARDIRPWPL